MMDGEVARPGQDSAAGPEGQFAAPIVLRLLLSLRLFFALFSVAGEEVEGRELVVTSLNIKVPPTHSQAFRAILAMAGAVLCLSSSCILGLVFPLPPFLIVFFFVVFWQETRPIR